jgi:transcriptional regulator with XRE-family HTH domain
VYSKKEIEVFRRRFVADVWREINRAFSEKKAEGFTQQSVADTLGVGKSTISKRLSGYSNMTLEILSDMARSMNMRPIITLERYEQFASKNNKNLRGVSDISTLGTKGGVLYDVDSATNASPIKRVA